MERGGATGDELVKTNCPAGTTRRRPRPGKRLAHLRYTTPYYERVCACAFDTYTTVCGTGYLCTIARHGDKINSHTITTVGV